MNAMSPPSSAGVRSACVRAASSPRRRSPSYSNHAIATTYCCYGSGQQGGSITDPQLATPVKGRYKIATDAVKEHIYAGLDKGNVSIMRSGILSWDDRTIADYLSQLVAEVREEKTSRGSRNTTRKYVWRKKRPCVRGRHSAHGFHSGGPTYMTGDVRSSYAAAGISIGGG